MKAGQQEGKMKGLYWQRLNSLKEQFSKIIYQIMESFPSSKVHPILGKIKNYNNKKWMQHIFRMRKT